MSAFGTRSREFWRYFRQGRRRDDAGLTLIELIVTLLVVSIVMTLSALLIVNVNQQSSSMLDTIKGIQSETGAEQSFVQYLQGATELLAMYNNSGTQIAPSATEMDMVVNEGFIGTNSGSQTNNWSGNAGAQYLSNCTNLDALWSVPASPAGADAQFLVGQDIPASGPPNQAPWSSVAANGTGPYTFTPTSPCAPTTALRSLSDYYALASQSMTVDPVFSYWKWGAATGNTLANVPPGLVQLPLTGGVIPAVCLSEVAAVGIHVTFLAGPQTPKEGFAADQPTTLHTLVFLIGSPTAGLTTTTTTTTPSSPKCSE
jgi:prepilin-type N-terminal cleavage/methylation domain-containing protein